MKKYIEYIESTRQKADEDRERNPNSFRAELMREFQSKCGYCGRKLGITSPAVIDHFYPESIFPEKSFELDNFLLCCTVCDRNKGNNFPIDAEGLPLLLNPRFDNFSDHITFDKNGSVTSKTHRGETTIRILNLNRPELIEERKLQYLEREFLETYTRTNDSYYKNFTENMKNIRELNKFSDMAKDDVQRHLRNMLYSNIITSLETYLSDAFINTVKSNETYVRRFVETFHNFKNEKFDLRELFVFYDSINDKVSKTMFDVIYHDLPKVKGMYLDTLNIEFPGISKLYKAVLKRHDFVHRNGKTKEGQTHHVANTDIEDLCNEVEAFINNINAQILALA